MVTGDKPDEQVDWSLVQRMAGRGWYVFGPRSLEGTRFSWIFGLGWFEVSVARRG